MLRSARIPLLALAAACCLLLVSCKNGRKGSGSSANAADSSGTVSVAKSDIAPGDFWRKFFDPARKFNPDTSLVAGVDPGDFVQTFENYANLLEKSDLHTALAAQDTCMALLERFEKAHPDSRVRRELMFLNDQFFYNTESPYRCEDYYIPILSAELKRLSASKSGSDEEMAERQRLHFRYDGCIMNRTGKPAKDLALIHPDGKKFHLRDIPAEYIVLIFSNPDCQACKDLISEFNQTSGTLSNVSPDRLAFISVYPDSDLNVWKKHAADYPESWLVTRCYIPDRTYGYDLRAIPSLYLLDKDKNVIMKDAPLDKILNYLNDRLK
jgi:hypothetical protein